MKLLEKAEFLTLAPELHPEFAQIPTTIFVKCNRKFVAARFERRIELPESGGHAKIAIFADTKFRLTVNGRVLGVGPVAAGGDYGNTLAMPIQYFSEYELDFTEPYLEILAEVQTPGEVMTDYSVGRGGFIFAAEISQGERVTELVSDSSWTARVDLRYDSVAQADLTRDLGAPEHPTVIAKADAPWKLAPSGLPSLTEEEIHPSSVERSGKCVRFDFPRIYSAYVHLKVTNHTEAPARLAIFAAEYGTPAEPQEVVTVPVGDSDYRGFRMRSIGEVTVEAPDGVSVELTLIYAHYPTDESVSGNFICSDEKLNDIYSLGRFTLEMCRQTLHLDSPLHQETLGCTGDYAIEALMTAVTFGDQRLTRLDLVRTADFLKMSGGVMFHTSYSLIFVTMLRDYYRHTADLTLVRELLPTVELLFERFAGYIEEGIIENPPNWMFIEWGELDGFNLHHPPKALGQTAMNSFYRLALMAAIELHELVGSYARADELRELAETHRLACVAKFYEPDSRLWNDGDCDSLYEPNRWLPANASRRYHTRHASILAALAGFLPDSDSRELISRVIEKQQNFEDFDIQPYFMHYLMEAVRKLGLFGKYGLELVHLWDKQLEQSPKGMPEGWGKFVGDSSHAWGATPTYQLPMAVSGFEMLEPGYVKFSLEPNLYGLDFAEVTLPTVHGLVAISLKKGENPWISVPEAYNITSDGDKFIVNIKE